MQVSTTQLPHKIRALVEHFNLCKANRVNQRYNHINIDLSQNPEKFSGCCVSLALLFWEFSPTLNKHRIIPAKPHPKRQAGILITWRLSQGL